MNLVRLFQLTRSLAAVIGAGLLMSACGGGGDGYGGGGGGGGSAGGGMYSIGGTVSGLTGTVVLQNNGANDLSISANGPFTFSTRLGAGASYDVTVRTQPMGKTCAVANGSGSIAAMGYGAADVMNVTVTCA